MTTDLKKEKGQFYTEKAQYILQNFLIPAYVKHIVEPFVGRGDLINWIENANSTNYFIEKYDIDPKFEGAIKKDTLKEPPDYNGKYIITNPPYLARNKTINKEVFEKYNTNDLYKCFIRSMVDTKCIGGIFIIPAGFFFSSRDNDSRLRNDFMSKYRITKVNYFEETVFDDTTTTIVAFQFEKSGQILENQNIEWIRFPLKDTKTFYVSASNHWIIGGEIYHLNTSPKIKIIRYVSNKKIKNGEQQTFLLLNALDSGKKDGRISLTYKKDYIYPAKESSRTYATLIISGAYMNEEEQIRLCKLFNKYLESKREEYWSLFLPQFRESKEYARKRIPFELAYTIVNYIIQNELYS